MYLNLQQIRHKLLSLAGGAVDSIEKACVESWTVAPILRQTLEPAIYLPENLELVTGSWEGTTVQEEIDFLKGLTKDHASTVAYRLRNVSVAGGALYSGRWKERLLVNPPADSSRSAVKHVKSATVACSWSGNHFFGHWMTDDLTLHLAAEEIGEPVILKRKPYLHEPGYRQLLNIWCEQVDRAEFEELVILRDFGQNSYKRQRYEILRRRIREQVKPVGAKRVLLSRGNLGQSRTIVNKEELESYLGSQGFSIVEPEKLTPAEIAAQAMGADIVIGVEGSQMSHAFMTMADDAIICCLQPPTRFTATIKYYTDSLETLYETLVGHPAPGGFRIDIDELKRMLDKIELELAHRSGRQAGPVFAGLSPTGSASL
jgi:hypothetical protein